MAKSTRILILLVCAVFGALQIAGAQRKADGDRDFEDGRFWLGGSISNSLRFGGGTFSFGLAPMAGYQVVPNLSVGPFVRLDYYYERIPYTPNSFVRYSSLDIGPGFFARADLFDQIFIQVEYEHGYLKREQYDNFGNVLIEDGKILKETFQENFIYVGAGYASGRDMRYAVSLHYNVLDDPFSMRFPWDIRINLRFPLNTHSR